jgi:hypothetical protein
MTSHLSLRRFAIVIALVVSIQAAFAAPKQPLYKMHVLGPFRLNDAQTLYCDASYSVAECRRQMKVLLQALRPYSTTLAPNWKWVLVTAEDWKPLLTSYHLDTDSPAVTSLDDSVTLLDESLIKARPNRAAELMNGFKIPMNQLLDLAISHELGHAMCHESNEARADEIGRDLRKKIAAGEALTASCLRPVTNGDHEGK